MEKSGRKLNTGKELTIFGTSMRWSAPWSRRTHTTFCNLGEKIRPISTVKRIKTRNEERCVGPSRWCPSKKGKKRDQPILGREQEMAIVLLHPKSEFESHFWKVDVDRESCNRFCPFKNKPHTVHAWQKESQWIRVPRENMKGSETCKKGNMLWKNNGGLKGCASLLSANSGSMSSKYHLEGNGREVKRTENAANCSSRELPVGSDNRNLSRRRCDGARARGGFNDKENSKGTKI